MKIKSIKLENFKRFTDLTIAEIPETAKLVVMIGPNGSGKSSVFDALYKYKLSRGKCAIIDDSYYIKFGSSEEVYIANVKVDFYTGDPKTEEEWQKSIRMRTAYRNDLASGSEITTGISEGSFSRLAENDEAVASNYGQLLNQWIEHSTRTEQGEKKVGDLQDMVYGDLRDAIEELFKDPQLILSSLGSPTGNIIFEFAKAMSHGFSYHNLSSGEKAALDLLLDVVVYKAEYKNTVFCIDEPEAHMHTKLQGTFLGQLYKLIPDESQLWIATHSIGMVRKAQDFWREDENSVVFLDFGKEGIDFDKGAIIKPSAPNPSLWERKYSIPFKDMTELVASEQYVFCEGENFDEICYQRIFENYHLEVRFISIGGRNNVEKTVKAMKGKIAKGAKVIGVVDRDKRTKDGIKRKTKEGIRTLEWGEIEDYLLHDEVLTQLCVSKGKSDKVQEFLTAKNKKIEEVINDDTIHDKRRPIIQRIQEQAEIVLGLVHSGDTVEDFMIDVLVPLIKPDMDVYKQLHEDIFGE